MINFGNQIMKGFPNGFILTILSFGSPIVFFFIYVAVRFIKCVFFLIVVSVFNKWRRQMFYWVISVYIAHIIGGGLWAAHLYNKGDLMNDYPYDDDM